MRDRDTIDSELRRLAVLRRSIRGQGGELSSRQLDELLDERLEHLPEPSQPDAAESNGTEVTTDTRSPCADTHNTGRHERKAPLRHFAPRAALPLSVLIVAMVGAAVLVLTFTAHRPRPAAQPTVTERVPAPDARSGSHPSDTPSPSPSQAHTSAPDIADTAFIDTLKREGVPVPSDGYAMARGHAVCDSLAQHPDFAEAVRAVQRSSPWDADQSAQFAAGAIVAYCPHFETARLDEVQKVFQNTLSELQAIEGALQGIDGDLQGIRDGLHAVPGQR